MVYLYAQHRNIFDPGLFLTSFSLEREREKERDANSLLLLLQELSASWDDVTSTRQDLRVVDMDPFYYSLLWLATC